MNDKTEDRLKRFFSTLLILLGGAFGFGLIGIFGSLGMFPLYVTRGVLAAGAAGTLAVAALNTGLYPVDMELPWDGPTATDALSGQQFLVVDGTLRLTVPPLDGLLLI